MNFIGTMDVIKARKGQWKTPMKKMGPNDAFHVIWATGESFIIIIHLFSMPNDVYR